MNSAADFLSGVCGAAFFASGIFFVKFWLASKDRLFLFFAVATFLLAIERVVLLVVKEFTFSSNPNIAEANSWVYLMRLLAFFLIMAAIVDKNRHWLDRKRRG